MTLYDKREALKKAKLNIVANSSNLVKGNDDVVVVTKRLSSWYQEQTQYIQNIIKSMDKEAFP